MCTHAKTTRRDEREQKTSAKKDSQPLAEVFVSLSLWKTSGANSSQLLLSYQTCSVCMRHWAVGRRNRVPCTGPAWIHQLIWCKPQATRTTTGRTGPASSINSFLLLLRPLESQEDWPSCSQSGQKCCPFRVFVWCEVLVIVLLAAQWLRPSIAVPSSCYSAFCGTVAEAKHCR